MAWEGFICTTESMKNKDPDYEIRNGVCNQCLLADKNKTEGDKFWCTKYKMWTWHDKWCKSLKKDKK